MNRSVRTVWCAVLSVGAAVGGAGCQSGYRNFSAALDQRIEAGDFSGAARMAAARAERGTGDRNNRVIYNLEAGRAAQMAGDLETSRVYFDRVHTDVRPYLDTQAEDRITQAVSTTVVNQTTSAYIGTPVDRVMATALNAVNSIGLGDLEEARVQLNLTREWQEEAVRRFADRIERSSAQLESEAKGRGVGLDRQRVDGIMATHYADLEDQRSYSDFRNPFASHLRGVFLLATSADPSDTERARFELRQVLAMEPGTAPVITPDLDRIEGGTGPAEPAVWVYVMAGRGPWLEEMRLEIPIPFGNVNYVAAAFPVLRSHQDWIGGVSVSAGSVSSEAVLLADVESMVAVEFRARLPQIIFQEILSSALKAAATYAAREQAGDWGLLIGLVYQAASTAADTRMWRTLPSRVLLARVPTPEDGVLTARYAGVTRTIPVKPGQSHIIVLTLPHAGVPAPSVVSASLTPARGGQEVVHGRE